MGYYIGIVIIGIDVGYRKLIVTSDKQTIGDDMGIIYNSIVHKQKNSKAYKKALKERDNRIGRCVNQINTDGIDVIVVEKLNNVKYKSDYDRKTNDLMSRWTYRPLLDKIERMCEVKGIRLLKVSPAYTSQTCSVCGSIHEENRQGQLFKCIVCGYEADADDNAAVNINNRGVYSLSG